MFAHEQPEPAVWDALVRSVDEWNRWDGPRVDTEVDGMRLRSFDDAQQAAQERIVTQLRRIPGAVVQVSSRQHLEDADYAVADLVGFSGVDLAEGFVSSEGAALLSLPPCQACGQQDLFDREQVGPFVIDERQLDRPSADGSLPSGVGWDLVSLPHGGLAVSRRLFTSWEAEGLTGLVPTELVGWSTGRPSQQVVQVSAAQAFVLPCAVHTLSEGAPHCQLCGRARSTTCGFVHTRRDQAGGVDVVSAHPGRHALLYLSRHAYDLTVALAPAGLLVDDAWLLCEH